MKKYRFGILGSGGMGRTHAEAVRRLPNAELVAVCGGSRAPGLAKEYEMVVEPDVKSLVQRSDIDAILVTTPHHVHMEGALSALSAGKHVLVEKPLATTVADCDRMIALAASKKLTLAVGYHQRFRRNNARARTLIQEGAIGKVIVAHMTMPMFGGIIKTSGFGGDYGWWNNPASVGHLINIGPHAIDLMRWFTGGDVVTVSAFSRTFIPDIPVEDTTLGLLELSTGAICSLFSSRALPAPSFPGEDFRFRIVGSTGLLDLDPYSDLRLSDAQGWRTVSQQPPVNHEKADTAFGDTRMQSFCDQLKAFIAAIEGQPSEVGTGADGRAGVEAVVAMHESSKGKRWVYPRSG